MDVVQGDFRWDSSTGKVVSPVGKKTYLDPEIAGEGTKVIMSDGKTVTYTPPAVKPTIPDWSTFKSIQHYFNRKDFYFFPCWLYHADGRSVIAETAQDAGEKYGVWLKKRTKEEQMQFGGGEYRWEFAEGSEWRPQPQATPKFDPANIGQGKNYMPKPPDPKIAQNELLADLIPTVTAAVITAMKASGQGASPANVDQNEWNEFLAFKAWKQSQKVVEAVVQQEPQEDEQSLWEAKAAEAGIKIDRRWSLDRLRKEVMSALEQRVQAAEQANEDTA